MLHNESSTPRSKGAPRSWASRLLRALRDLSDESLLAKYLLLLLLPVHRQRQRHDTLSH